MDAALHLEEEHMREGRADGLREGRLQGRAEGYELGKKRGEDIAREVGFYAGAVEVWKGVAEASPDAFSARALQAVTALDKRLGEFPLEDPKDEGLFDSLEFVRGKYRAVCTMLSVKPLELKDQLSF